MHLWLHPIGFAWGELSVKKYHSISYSRVYLTMAFYVCRCVCCNRVAVTVTAVGMTGVIVTGIVMTIVAERDLQATDQADGTHLAHRTVIGKCVCLELVARNDVNDWNIQSP